MKYLKSIRNIGFKPMNKDIIENISDILLELKDIGFDYNLHLLESNIEIFKFYEHDYDNFKYDEIGDTIERIKDYMIKNGYSTKIEKKYRYGSTPEQIVAQARKDSSTSDRWKSLANHMTNISLIKVILKFR